MEENNHVFISDIVMTMGVDMRLNSSLTGALSAGRDTAMAMLCLAARVRK